MFSVMGFMLAGIFIGYFLKQQNYRETEYVDYLPSFIQYGAFHRQQQKHHRKSRSFWHNSNNNRTCSHCRQCIVIYTSL